MTEQPPVTPDNPTDSGSGTPPTPTEQAADATQQQVEQAQQPLSFADHVLYSQALYAQPAWVVASVFESGTLDKTKMYLQSEVQMAVGQMMTTPDNSFETEVPQ